MGITVYRTNPDVPLSDIVIDDNTIYDCEPADSETLTLNGNVDSFEVDRNVVHDVNNIGIDFIGGEGISTSPATDAARNGTCRDNVVYRARSSYGGGYAAGIYVDGGRNIVLERNIVHECDEGIEVGAENPGVTASVPPGPVVPIQPPAPAPISGRR
jgi:Right handed beta helix region